MIGIAHYPTPPEVGSFAERIWNRLPGAYRNFDAAGGYPLRLYIDAVCQLPNAWDVVIARILGQRGIGPAAPEPWALSPTTLEQWRTARITRPSALGDPFQADPGWLDWLAQFVGARLDRESDVATRRNAVRYAVGGWRAGTRPSVEYAARPTLTGSQYARCIPRMRADNDPPGPWDLAIVTRSSETPDPAATVAAILRAGVKPAGVALHHRPYEASWDVLEAVRPTWDLWEEDFQGPLTWDRLAETGLTYASVPGNLLTNSSFETDVAGWSAGANTTLTHNVGGLDGFGHALLTATGSGQVSMHNTTPVAVNDLQDYRLSCSVQPELAHTARLHASFDAGSAVDGPDVTVSADTWSNRLVAIITAPGGSTTITVSVQVDSLTAGETVRVDAFDLRLYQG